MVVCGNRSVSSSGHGLPGNTASGPQNPGTQGQQDGKGRQGFGFLQKGRASGLFAMEHKKPVEKDQGPENINKNKAVYV